MLENRKDAIGLIMESIGDRKTYEEAIKDFESLREEYSDIHESYNYDLDEYFNNHFGECSIDEAKMVTFGGEMFPKYGWAVVMAGGAGSGKGYTRGHMMGIDAKVFDVDELKTLYIEMTKRGKKGESERDWNLRNPDDVGELHQIIKGKGYKDSQEKHFFKTNNKESNLSNVIYDITGDEPSKLANVGKKLKEIGYKTSLVIVVTNREVAFYRNQSRERVVPEVVFHSTHNAVSTQILPYVKSADAKYYDEAWVVFSSADSGKSLTPEQEKELKNLRVIQLVKSGSSFIVPKALEDRIYSVFGPQEPDPLNPKRYLTYKEYNPDNSKEVADKQEDRVKSGELRVLKR